VVATSADWDIETNSAALKTFIFAPSVQGRILSLSIYVLFHSNVTSQSPTQFSISELANIQPIGNNGQ
jgi:hypothetical protein